MASWAASVLFGAMTRVGPLQLLDQPGGRGGLAGAGRAEQDGVLDAGSDPAGELLDRGRLVAGRLEVGLDDERRQLGADRGHSGHSVSNVRRAPDTSQPRRSAAAALSPNLRTHASGPSSATRRFGGQERASCPDLLDLGLRARRGRRRCRSRTSRAASRCSRLACSAIRARASASVIPRTPVSRSSWVSLRRVDDHDDVVALGEAGLDEQRDVVDHDAVGIALLGGGHELSSARSPTSGWTIALSRLPRVVVAEDDARRAASRSSEPSAASTPAPNSSMTARQPGGAGLDDLARDRVGSRR